MIFFFANCISHYKDLSYTWAGLVCVIRTRFVSKPHQNIHTRMYYYIDTPLPAQISIVMRLTSVESASSVDEI